MKSEPKGLIGSVLTTLGLGLLGYAVVTGLLYAMQDHMLFHPTSTTSAVPNPAVSDFELIVDRQRQLRTRGKILNPTAAGPVIVYFGGNAEDGTAWSEYFVELGLTAVLTNYRGYGRSDGRPSETSILHDGDIILDWVEKEFPHRPVVLMGRSLGTGVATILAERADGLILLSPYRSLVHVVNSYVVFKLFPIRTLLRHPFDTAEFTAKAPPKLLVMYSTIDTVIPARESIKALQRLPTAKVVKSHVPHNRIATDKESWRQIGAWLAAEF